MVIRLEADWEFEVGGAAPIIDALWPGFVDLRWTPQSAPDRAALVFTLPEAAQLPCLAGTLKKLNAEHSPVWTSKCDFWPALQAGEFDADEMDAPAGSFAHAVGCYIDLLPRIDQPPQSDQQPRADLQWSCPDAIASSCRDLCTRLHSFPLRCCRVDLIVRRAQIHPGHLDMGQLDLGLTVYFAACGPTPTEAVHTLEAALAAFADAACPQSTLQ
jgi:hypothetical protein